MKKILLLFLVYSLLASASAIQINEIMYNPGGSDNNKEFIEIYFDDYTNLTDWVVADSYSNDTLVMLQNFNSSYALIVENGFNYSDINASIYSAGAAIGNNLNNDEDSIFLYSSNFTLINNLTYTSSWGANGDNNSLQLVNGSWLASSPTPGTENNISIEENPPEENITNETTPTEEDWCDLSVSINASEIIKDNEIGYKLRVQDLHCQNIEHEYSIKYWIIDLFGHYLKKSYTSTYDIICSDTSYHQKKTEEICGLDAYYIEAEITKHGCNDNNSLNDYTKQLVIVKGKSLNSSVCDATEIVQIPEVATISENISENKTSPITGAVVWFDEKANNFTTLVLLYCFILLIFVISLIQRS